MNDHDNPTESENKVPKGMTAFFIFCIVFVVGYVVLYTPAISGWSYYTIFEKKMADAETVALTEGAGEKQSFSGDEAAIAEGADIYASSCAVCHNADGTGGIASDLTAELKFGDSQQELYESIADGREGGMPPFKQQLSKTKILKVIAFMETLRK